MVVIARTLSPEEYGKARLFLDHIKPLLKTGDCHIAFREKNNNFDKMYNLRDKEKRTVIENLTALECVDIGPNNNSRFIEAEVYTFITRQTLLIYGEEETLTLYIKMYCQENRTHDEVIVISFHLDGEL